MHNFPSPTRSVTGIHTKWAINTELTLSRTRLESAISAQRGGVHMCRAVIQLEQVPRFTAGLYRELPTVNMLGKRLDRIQ